MVGWAETEGGQVFAAPAAGFGDSVATGSVWDPQSDPWLVLPRFGSNMWMELENAFDPATHLVSWRSEGDVRFFVCDAIKDALNHSGLHSQLNLLQQPSIFYPNTFIMALAAPSASTL